MCGLIRLFVFRLVITEDCYSKLLSVDNTFSVSVISSLCFENRYV